MASLESLPVEIAELILNDLPLVDIRSLRLVSRTVRDKTSQGRFKAFCNTKQVDCRVHALREVANQIYTDSVGCNIEHLKITGLVYVTKTLEKNIRLKTIPADPTDILAQRRDELGNQIWMRPSRVPADDDQLAQAKSKLEVMEQWQLESAHERSSGQDVEALVYLFERIRHYGVRRRILTIRFEIAVMRDTQGRLTPHNGGEWRPIWENAAHTFSATMKALAHARLAVDLLDVYSNLTTCSLPGFDIACTLGQLVPGTVDNILSNTKALSLSTSNRALPAVGFQAVHDADPDDEVQEHMFGARGPAYERPEESTILKLEAMASDARNVIGVAQLLRKTPVLEQLDLHSYQLYCETLSNNVFDDYQQAMFGSLFRTASLHRLKKLTLRGFSPLADDLLSLLRANPDLECVDLRQFLLHGAWQPIFDHFTNVQHKYVRLHFDVLFEQRSGRSEYVSFSGAKTSWIPAPRGAAALTVEGRKGVLKGIEFRLIEHWVMGCVEHSMWREERRISYGPPGIY